MNFDQLMAQQHADGVVMIYDLADPKTLAQARQLANNSAAVSNSLFHRSKMPLAEQRRYHFQIVLVPLRVDKVVVALADDAHLFDALEQIYDQSLAVTRRVGWAVFPRALEAQLGPILARLPTATVAP